MLTSLATVTSLLMPNRLLAHSGGSMFIAFRWVFSTIALLALSSCRAFPSAPTIVAPAQPEIFYIHDSKLTRQPLGQEPQALLTLPDMGAVRDALKVDDTVFVLRELGLQKVSLADHSVEGIAQFGNPIGGGALFAQGESVFYSLDEELRQYDIAKGTTRKVLSYPHAGFFKPLGLTQDGKGFYLLPLAGDPEFPAIWEVNLTNGEVTELPVGIGHEFAALAPDSRHLVTVAVHSVLPEGSLEYGLGLFDLSTFPPSGQFLTLPNPPSHIAYGLAWSPDSRWVYFLLRPGMPWDEPTTSYGLWRFEVETGTFSRTADIDNPTMHLVSISPDGEWMLLRPEVERYLALVHISTGEVKIVELPTGRVEIVRW